ncbi:MAG: hypothetical protein IID40_11830 [Planctomycetes bacterium]|nr:hypothetical protein [Planctomycetota bacterium]
MSNSPTQRRPSGWARSCPTLAWAWALLLPVAAGTCRRAAEDPLPPPPDPEPEILDFPKALQAKDPTVNTFVRRVIETCASGDYDAFRLLWSARDDPFPRDQFHRAWQSVRKVRIVSLRPVREAESGNLFYAVRAQVELDPAVREPQRDVTIILAFEDGHWRLTAPTNRVPDALFEPPAPSSQPAARADPVSPS